MANRPVFMVAEEPPFVDEVHVDFEYFPGLSVKQKRRSIASLQEAFLAAHPSVRVTEISTKADSDLGVALSGFNLKVRAEDVEGGGNRDGAVGAGDGASREGEHAAEYPIEAAYQSAKVFENGGPFVDLLDGTGRDAKRDPRLQTSGPLRALRFAGREFPLEPRAFLYDWLYATALARRPDLVAAAARFDAFTDIEFNPKKVFHCQARSAAKVVGLYRQGLFDEALASPEAFLELGYPRG